MSPAPNDRPDVTARPVVALYDGSSSARDTVVRAATSAARTVVVAKPGADERLGELASLVDEWVWVRSPDLESAVAAAVAHEAPWVCIPSTLMPSEELMADGLRRTAEALGPQRPSLVLHVVRSARPTPATPVRAVMPYTRVVLVSDLAETTGLASYAASAIAARSAATLDIVVIGRDERGDDLQRLVSAAAERTDHDSVVRGRHALHAGAVLVEYLPGGAGADPVASALQVVEGLGPDLLVVGLGAQRLLEMSPTDGPSDGVGRMESMLASSRGRLVSNLLAWLAVDVALVLDPVGPATALAAARARLGRAVDATVAEVRSPL